MPTAGKKATVASAVGEVTNIGRATVYGALPEAAWVYRWGVLGGRTSGTATYVRGHVLGVSGGVPGALLGNTAELAVTNLGSYGGDLAPITGDLTSILGVAAGTSIALGFASRGGAFIHGLATAPGGSNPAIYQRATIGSTGPYNPWSHTSIPASSWIVQWIEYVANVKPNVPINRAPSGMVSSAPSAYTGAFRDTNETVNGVANGSQEKLNQLRIQLREAGSGSLKWDTTLTANGGEQTARAFSRAFAGTGTIDPGMSYEWRCAVSDHHGFWSDWSSWLAFQVGSAGTASIQASPGVSGRITTQTPTGFAVSYAHPTAKDTDAQEIQILAGGTVIREQAITANHNSGDSFALAPVWGGGGGEWASLAWGQSLTWRWRAIDEDDAPTAWSPEVAFNTNYRPSTPSNLAPAGGVVSYGYPLLTFVMSDQDNTVATGLAAEVRIKEDDGDLLATREATLLSDSTWGYQTDAGDVDATATYRWDARGTDPDLDGNWSAEADFFYADAPEVAEPDPNDTVPSSALAIDYDVTGQVSRRFAIYPEGNTTALLVTAWETTGDLTATLDLSGIATNGARYELVIEIELTGAVLTYSPRVPFVIVLDPTHSVEADTGSGPVAIGAEPDTSAIRLTIGDTDGIDGDNFIAWRVKEGPADWTDRWAALLDDLPVDAGEALAAKATLAAELVTAAESTSFAATELTYFEPRLNVARTYALTCVVQDGVNQIESFPANPFAATCEAHAVILSDVADPVGRRMWLAYLADADYTPVDSRVLVDTWGDDPLPSSIAGVLDYRVIGETYDLLPVGELMTPREARDALDTLRKPRADGTPSVVCYRNDIGDKIAGMEITKLSAPRSRMGRIAAKVELREVRRG